MKYYIDFAKCNVNKYGEELCGDNVEVAKTEDGIIIVLADGLGSGVKANILATLTSKIAVTMLKEGASIEETILTIASTLPQCRVRKLAYSTFTIVHIKDDGQVYMVEYDNPPVFYYRKGESMPIYREERIINKKTIRESHFRLQQEDTLVLVSDGAIHAGVGMTLNLGWQWEHIDEYLRDLVHLENRAVIIARQLLSVCENLYANKPGDDTTVVAIRLKPIQYVDVFVGPPKDPQDDQKMMDIIKNAKGKVVLCGGTTANIVARETNQNIQIDLEYYTEKVPPMGYMAGVEFVTEGLLTLNAAKEMLEHQLECQKTGESDRILGYDGASKLVRLWMQEATHIHFWIGQAVNPAHQNPYFPQVFNLKNKVVLEIESLLKQLGKRVIVDYL